MAVGTLIKLGGNLDTPRDSKPSDYPGVGPSGPAGEKEPGEGKLIVKSADPASPSDFKVSKSSAGGSAVKGDCYVDLSSGAHY